MGLESPGDDRPSAVAPWAERREERPERSEWTAEGRASEGDVPEEMIVRGPEHSSSRGGGRSVKKLKWKGPMANTVDVEAMCGFGTITERRSFRLCRRFSINLYTIAMLWRVLFSSLFCDLFWMLAWFRTA